MKLGTVLRWAQNLSLLAMSGFMFKSLIIASDCSKVVFTRLLEARFMVALNWALPYWLSTSRVQLDFPLIFPVWSWCFGIIRISFDAPKLHMSFRTERWQFEIQITHVLHSKIFSNCFLCSASPKISFYENTKTVVQCPLLLISSSVVGPFLHNQKDRSPQKKWNFQPLNMDVESFEAFEAFKFFSKSNLLGAFVSATKTMEICQRDKQILECSYGNPFVWTFHLALTKRRSETFNSISSSQRQRGILWSEEP